MSEAEILKQQIIETVEEEEIIEDPLQELKEDMKSLEKVIKIIPESIRKPMEPSLRQIYTIIDQLPSPPQDGEIH